MPQIELWGNLPEGVWQHLIDQLRLWVDTRPQAPEGGWCQDFGSFKICGSGSYPKTFLLRGQAAKGEAL